MFIMSKEEIYESMQELKSKINCMAYYKGDHSEVVDFGFYLIMSEFSQKLEDLSNDVYKLGEDSSKKLSELFDAKK